MGNVQKIIFPVALLAVFGLGYMFAFRPPPKNGIIQTEIAPHDSSITIDDRPASDGNNKVVAGKHSVTVSRSGFAQQSKSITTQPGDSIYAGFVLQPNSSGTQNWYNSNPSDQKLAEGISSHTSDSTSKDTLASNSLLQKLPYSYGDGHGGLVAISYGVPASKNTSQSAIYISADTPPDRQGALTWIRNNGYRPSRMDIVFAGASFVFSPEGRE